jgi:hypothetical protein
MIITVLDEVDSPPMSCEVNNPPMSCEVNNPPIV